MGATAERQAWSAPEFQRCCDPSLSHFEGAVWAAIEAGHRFCAKLVATHWFGLGSADFSTLCRRQRTLKVSLPYRGGTGPLNLLIDSTGIKAEGEGEWNARKHGGSKRRIWRKIHIEIDEETLEVRAVEITSSSVRDAPVLPDLLNQIPPNQDIGSVTADGAYDTRKCHEAIAARDAYAVIPPRKNAKPWKSTSDGAIARNDAVNAQRYLGRTLWRRWSGYHRRSRVETKMHCLKLMGQSLMARDFDRQVAEVQIRIPVLNRYTALGIPVTDP